MTKNKYNRELDDKICKTPIWQSDDIPFKELYVAKLKLKQDIIKALPQIVNNILFILLGEIIITLAIIANGGCL